MNQRSRKQWLVVSICIVCIAAAVFGAVWLLRGKKPEQSKSSGNPIESAEEPHIERGEDGLPDYSTIDPNEFADWADSVNAGEGEQNESAVQPAVDAPADEYAGELQSSGLVIHTIQPYSGVFIETNEDVECTDAATALFENTTDKMISLAIVEISAGEKTWRFEASAVPAGALVAVQEKNGAEFTDATVSCTDVQIGFEENPSLLEDRVRVEEIGDNQLKITNISDQDIASLRLFYKIKEDNMYFGGITYTIQLSDLSAGGSQTIYPAHYAKGYSEIIMIKEYNN